VQVLSRHPRLLTEENVSAIDGVLDQFPANAPKILITDVNLLGICGELHTHLVAKPFWVVSNSAKSPNEIGIGVLSVGS
jgi:hypothetical protein